MVLDIELIHTCNITHKVPVSENSYGEPVLGGTPVASACRFYRAKGTIISPESGLHHISEPKLILPPSATIAEGDIVTSSITHFAGPFRVEQVDPLTELYSSDIDHFECFLKAVRV